LSYFAPVF